MWSDVVDFQNCIDTCGMIEFPIKGKCIHEMIREVIKGYFPKLT